VGRGQGRELANRVGDPDGQLDAAGVVIGNVATERYAIIRSKLDKLRDGVVRANPVPTGTAGNELRAQILVLEAVGVFCVNVTVATVGYGIPFPRVLVFVVQRPRARPGVGVITEGPEHQFGVRNTPVLVVIVEPGARAYPSILGVNRGVIAAGGVGMLSVSLVGNLLVINVNARQVEIGIFQKTGTLVQAAVRKLVLNNAVIAGAKDG